MAVGRPRDGGGVIMDNLNRGCLYWALGLLVLLGLGGSLLFVYLQDRAEEPPGGDRVTSEQRQESPAPPSPGGDPPAEQPDPVRLVLPDEAGGLDLTFSGGPEVAARQASMERAGIAVTELVGGRYEGGDVLVTFHGGGLAEPLTTAQVDENGRELLETTFAANFPNLTPGASTGYDAGPRGGQVWCTAYDDVSSHACGWLDEETVGFVFRSGGAESDTADLLVRMRESIQAG
jgi:hypothetical protein